MMDGWMGERKEGEKEGRGKKDYWQEDRIG
jgi:hypothetical protein